MNNIGLIGLGVMGSALARNFESRGLKVAVYNRSPEKTDEFIQKYPGNFQGFKNLDEFVESLEKPRKTVLMISAGPAVDEAIEQLMPLLEKGDIIMDGGNSFYKDTERREKVLAKKRILFLGTGISGGKKGALEGPSIMPGGSEKAWKIFQPILEKIAALDFEKKPCVAYMGHGGSGHYVKMVHNGIEYAVMQMISEMCYLLKNIYNLSNIEIAEVFKEWNNGHLQSFLIEITSKVFRNEVLEQILDVAEQKGTGTWIAIESLSQGVPAPTIAEAVFARGLSKLKKERGDLSKKFKKPTIQKEFTLEEKEKCGKSLYAAILLSYSQGFSLLKNFDSHVIARIWQGGCIIRSELLRKPEVIFDLQELAESLPCLRELIKKAIDIGAPIPAITSSLEYIESLTTEHLPTNIIQGLRDYFGAHGFQRTDQSGTFHGDWET